MSIFRKGIQSHVPYTHDIIRRFHQPSNGDYYWCLSDDVKREFYVSPAKVANKYINSLTKAATDEIMETGRCWLLEFIVNEPDHSIFSWDCIAMKLLIDNFPDCYVGYSERPFGVYPAFNSWYQTLDKYVKIGRGSDIYRAFQSFLDTKVYSLQQKERSYDEREEPVKAQTGMRAEQGAVGSHSEENSLAFQHAADVDADRERICGEGVCATQHSAGSNADAKPTVSEQIADNRPISDSREEAARILNDARLEAEQIRTEILAEANKIADSIKREAESEARLIRKQLKDERNDLMRSVIDTISSEGDDTWAADYYYTVRNEIGDDIRSLREDFSQRTEQLYSGFKAEMINLTRECRQSLYALDAQHLATFFSNFHNYVTVVAVKKLEMEKDDGTINALNAQLKELTNLLQQLERLLSRLGLVFYRPQQGDSFDDIYQMASNVNAMPGAPIKRCLAPGIKLGGENDTVLRKALIETEGESENG